MSFKVYKHPAIAPLLQQALKQSLPYSINLVYRTQHSNRTPDAHILATFPLDELLPNCWAAAYFDRSMRPETELWVFASGEIPGHSPSPPQNNSSFCPTCKSAVHSILQYISTLPVPPLHPENQPSLEIAKEHKKQHPETGSSIRYPISQGSYLRHLLLPAVVTVGAVYHEIANICMGAGLVREEFPGLEAELNKFLFKVSDLPKTKELPEGLQWGEMRKKDIQIVQARTPIPRATRTLLSLKSVRVYEEKTDRPVAWAFLGLDGSLTTLHVEAEYRGQGIAKSVAAKLFREHAPGLVVDMEGNAWSHADVYVGNVQSEAVCRSLGGKPLWKIFWVRIDLATAEGLGGTE
ncbi:hypothetical protein K469DRAFT_705334 [Zopfia rhizophila CBS 207.26]|uniref:FR47-like domain-containing protein n=1 Tax=Zopfia rhizophila CBS 207.26 TaxID=1314779 RepID=A0A6A6E8H8_9PEZI|nr:hypothetical protein K469DRAFT_705334 [Zopfia rhizophila CBS 207.26]